MRALVFEAPGCARIVSASPPSPRQGEALIAPRYVGLCGTDLELYEGSHPFFAEGYAHYPLQPGHEVSGLVVECPGGEFDPDTPVIIDSIVGCGTCARCLAGIATQCPERFELGVRRDMPGGACELVVVPCRQVHTVRSGVSLRDAALVEPGVTSLNAVERLGECAGKHALVIGAGTLGLIASELLVNRGATVDVLSRRAHRIHELAKELGVGALDEVLPDSYDLVVEASGSLNAFQGAISAVAPGGVIALVATYASRLSDIDANALVSKDVTVHGVLNGPGLYDKLLHELETGSFRPSLLIDAEFELGEATAAIKWMTEGSRDKPKVLLRVDREVA